MMPSESNTKRKRERTKGSANEPDENTSPDFALYALELAKLNSFKRNFFLSIVKGVGTALGATLIAGVVLSIFFRIIDSAEAVPLLNDIVERLQITPTGS